MSEVRHAEVHGVLASKGQWVRLAKANGPAGGAEDCLWLAKANGG